MALGLLSQAFQVGLRSQPEPFVFQPSLPPDLRAESHCHCACICNSLDVGIAGAAGSVTGALGVLLAWVCSLSRRRVAAPSPRRRGHGVISGPLSWGRR